MKLKQLNEELDFFEDMYNAYLQAVFFTEEDDLTNVSVEDLSGQARLVVSNAIKLFKNKAEKHLKIAVKNSSLSGIRFWTQVAHDLWLTRNGHGAGFWDDPEYYGGQENADMLSKIATEMGEQHAYVGDDGKIYIE